ncbi:hypothetical protein FOMPIDRAFT_1135923 [Fomitopsis schrenkii]|uniref:Uncharacterized protein n=1 Tax=Fomitopsis schrenkii TaxID=2126942 RepID=S8DQQ1_FOMSC|nr:hypothetical protein FOMPIDRAFT_1135923 [Fomitopsis schrenkii]
MNGVEAIAHARLYPTLPSDPPPHRDAQPPPAPSTSPYAERSPSRVTSPPATRTEPTRPQTGATDPCPTSACLPSTC